MKSCSAAMAETGFSQKLLFYVAFVVLFVSPVLGVQQKKRDAQTPQRQENLTPQEAAQLEAVITTDLSFELRCFLRSEVLLALRGLGIPLFLLDPQYWRNKQHHERDVKE